MTDHSALSSASPRMLPLPTLTQWHDSQLERRNLVSNRIASIQLELLFITRSYQLEYSLLHTKNKLDSAICTVIPGHPKLCLRLSYLALHNLFAWLLIMKISRGRIDMVCIRCDCCVVL